MGLSCRTLALILSLFTLITATAPPLIAQDREPAASEGIIQVQGVVRSQLGRPIRGAEVSLNGKVLARTGEDGSFELRVPVGEVAGTPWFLIGASGYESQRISVQDAPGATTVDVVLRDHPSPLEALVVGARSERPARFRREAIATVDAQNVASNGAARRVWELLQGRVPGVSVTNTTGSPGAPPRVLVRGARSVMGAGPAIFLDGVRIDVRARMLMGDMRETSPLAGISLEEIESVRVERGLSAVLWSGAEASAGAIHLTTRQGAGPGWFNNSLVMEYGLTSPEGLFPDNWVRCGDRPEGACAGQPAERVLRDNPLGRFLERGPARSVHWNSHGGGDLVDYFASVGWGREDGVIPGDLQERRSGRINLRIRPGSNLEVVAGLGYSHLENEARHELGGSSNYSPIGSGLMGSPHTVGEEMDGWWKSTLPTEVVSGELGAEIVRLQPSLAVGHHIRPWLEQRLHVGVDRVDQKGIRVRAVDGGPHPARLISYQRDESELRTIGYRLDASRLPGLPESHDLGFSFGVQLRRDDIEMAAEDSVFGDSMGPMPMFSSWQREEGRSTGLVVEGRYGYRSLIYFDAGARLDRRRFWNRDSKTYFSPRLGAEFHLSETGFWDSLRPVLDRVVIDGSVSRVSHGRYLPSRGMHLNEMDIPSGINPGASYNFEWGPERHSELELGVEALMLGGRVGVEWREYRIDSEDILLWTHLPPGSGLSGGVLSPELSLRSRGAEVAIGARLLERDGLQWDIRLGLSRQSVEVTGLKKTPFPLNGIGSIEVGNHLGSYLVRRVVEVDTVSGRAMVSNGTEFVGAALPRREGSIGSELSIKGLRIAGLVDWRSGHRVYNSNAELRDRMKNSERVAKRDELPAAERLRHFGPYHTESGHPVTIIGPLDHHFEDGSFVRLREISVSMGLPQKLMGQFGARSAELSVGGRNLALWTRYSGPDPEVLGSSLELVQRDAFLLPQTPRWSAQVRVHF